MNAAVAIAPHAAIIASVGTKLVAYNLVRGVDDRMEIVRGHWIDTFRPLHALHVGHDSGLIAAADAYDSVRLFKYHEELPRGFQVSTVLQCVELARV